MPVTQIPCFNIFSFWINTDNFIYFASVITNHYNAKKKKIFFFFFAVNYLSFLTNKFVWATAVHYSLSDGMKNEHNIPDRKLVEKWESAKVYQSHIRMALHMHARHLDSRWVNSLLRQYWQWHLKPSYFQTVKFRAPSDFGVMYLHFCARHVRFEISLIQCKFFKSFTHFWQTLNIVMWGMPGPQHGSEKS